ncbi:ELWxxDGT repeat protein [Nocardioides solisilvae]|uniref:ELWxxDGT repeat protein n=1 Tax=Nocardioides solisilvae TaxID=1542435 RepID=UPI0013A58600|nr:ELWxxDGT repeat protein [Nocardioides solisilvae]
MDLALVGDINAGPTGSDPYAFVTIGRTTFFAADDGVHGDELWATDGTSAGTRLVADLQPGPGAGWPRQMTVAGDTLFFTAQAANGTLDVWATDGTTQGTRRVSDLQSGYAEDWPSQLAAVGDTLFFAAYGPGGMGRELWTSDGTMAGTERVIDLRAGESSSFPEQLTKVGDALFFVADDGVHGSEVWRSDGTAAGTTRVTDLEVALRSSPFSTYDANAPWSLTEVAGGLFFSAGDAAHGRELWHVEASGANPRMVADVLPGTGDSDPYLNQGVSIGGTLFFTADDGTHGRELWRTDGTARGTSLLVDTNQTVEPSYARQFSVVSGTLFFSARTAERRYSLFASDGTTAGTTDLGISSVGYPNDLTSFGEGLYFTVTDADDNRALWRTDGSRAGTRELVALPDPPRYSRDLEMHSGADTLLLTFDDALRGKELWSVVPRGEAPDPSDPPTPSAEPTPTSGPTSGPTPGPTSGPTAAPTAPPTTAPTAGPTAGPTTAPPPDPDTAVTGVQAAAPKQQKIRKKVALTTRVGADEAITATATGKIKLKGSKKPIALRGNPTQAAPGQQARLTLRVTSKKLVAQVLKALTRYRNAPKAKQKKLAVKAVLTLSITDAAGNKQTVKRTIRLV